MKTSILILLAAAAAYCQSLTLRRGNETLPLTRYDEALWVVRIDNADFYLIARSTVDSLTRIIAEKDALIRRHEKVLAVQDSLLRRYAAYEEAADAHIAKQAELLAVADSLHQGYKSLYFDVKRLLGFAPLSFTTGVGLLHSNDTLSPAAALGFNYGRSQLAALVARRAWGAALAVKWPIGR